MLHRVAVIGSLMLGLASFASAQFDASARNNMDRPSIGQNANHVVASISGAVRASDNRGIPNARVEVHDLNGMLVSSTYSGPNGSFQIAGLTSGRYEVVATLGVSEAREMMALDHGDNAVVLRLNDGSAATADAGNADSVSVAAMRVPDKARKALGKAEQLLKKGRNDEAQKEIARALEICPQYSEALRERGVMRMIAGQSEEAKADFDQAIKYDPNDGMSYIAMAAVLNNQEKFDDALRALDRGVALTPNSWQAYFEIARSDLGEGKFEEALRATNKAQQFAQEDYPALHLVRAHALLGMKNYTEATSELEAYIAKEPDGENAAHVRKTLDEVKAFTARASSGK